MPLVRSMEFEPILIRDYPHTSLELQRALTLCVALCYANVKWEHF